MSSTIPSLMNAASEGDADAVRSLLGEGAEVNETTQSGQTPLMRAVIGGHVDTVRLLLAAGADVRLKDRVGLTAIEWAERRGFWAMAQLLTNASAADPSVPKSELTNQAPTHTPTGSESGPQVLAAAGATTDRDNLIVANRQTETAPESFVEEALRESATTEVTKSEKSDRKWIEGLQRIIADQERRIKEFGLQRAVPESNIVVDENVDVPPMEGRETTIRSERSEVEEVRPQIPPEAEVAIEASAYGAVEEPSQTIAEHARVEVEEVRQQIPPEAELTKEIGAHGAVEEPSQTIAEHARVEVEDVRQQIPPSAKLAKKIGAHGAVEEPSQTIAEPEPVEVEQVPQEFPVEAELLLGADAGLPLDEPSQLIAEPEPAGVEDPIRQSLPEAGLATDQNIDDQITLESEGPAKPEPQQLEPPNVEGAEEAGVAGRESMAQAMLVGEQEVVKSVELTDSAIDKEVHPLEDMRAVEAELERLKARRKSVAQTKLAVEPDVGSTTVQTSDSTLDKELRPPGDERPAEAERDRIKARKEAERAGEESRRRAEEEAFRRFQEEVVRKTQVEPRTNRARSSRQSITPAVASIPEYPSPTSWVRPTLWVLGGITLLGSIFVTYQLLNRSSETETSSAPVVETPAAPTVVKQNLPVVSGALSGLEVSVPEAEYPANARSEGVSGAVTVRVQVNKKGRVISVRSSKGDWRLRAAAVKAARNATFSPEKLAGQSERGRVVSGTITYNFLPPTESPAATVSQAPTQTTSDSATGSSATGSSTPTGSSAANVVADHPVVGGPLFGAERNVPQADYPKKALSKGNSSIVTVVVRVNRSGKVISWRSQERDPHLRAAAFRAARKATFDPDKLVGKGNVVGTITYNLKP